MKYLLLSLAILLTACSTGYEPSEGMLELKKNMSRRDAVAVLQELFWNEKGESSLCATRGFWFDKNAGMVVQEHNVALFAYKKGKLLRSEGGGFGGNTVYERAYYKYEFPFKNIREIVIHKSFTRLNKYRGCTKREEKEDYVVIDLFASQNSNIKFIAYEDQIDKVMAALTILVANRSVNVVNI